MPLNFLVVDDHADMAPVYEHSARLAGVSVVVKKNAYDALEYLGENSYQLDAAILDLNMPYIDGLDLSDQIRLNETPYRGDSPLPIFFYTGYTENDAIRKVKERNSVSGMFVKAEYAPLDVLKEIKAWLTGGQKQSQSGGANPNWLICFVAVIAQIVVASLFLWLLNRQDVAAAYEFTKMKSQRDQLKSICEDNALLNSQKEKFIEQKKLLLPPELSGQKPCQAAGKEDK